MAVTFHVWSPIASKSYASGGALCEVEMERAVSSVSVNVVDRFMRRLCIEFVGQALSGACPEYRGFDQYTLRSRVPFLGWSSWHRVSHLRT